jgi:hypothetical protein
MEEEMKLNDELWKFQKEERYSDIAMHEMIKEVLKLSELIKILIPQYYSFNPYEKETTIRYIFSELSVFENTLNYKCKKGFECLKDRFVALGDLKGWLSELRFCHNEILEAIKTLEKYIYSR